MLRRRRSLQRRPYTRESYPALLFIVLPASLSAIHLPYMVVRLVLRPLKTVEYPEMRRYDMQGLRWMPGENFLPHTL